MITRWQSPVGGGGSCGQGQKQWGKSVSVNPQYQAISYSMSIKKMSVSVGKCEVNVLNLYEFSSGPEFAVCASASL